MRIVGRIGIFGNVEIFLDETSRVGEEGPVSTSPAAILIRLNDAIGANRDKAAIGNLKLPVEFRTRATTS